MTVQILHNNLIRSAQVFIPRDWWLHVPLPVYLLLGADDGNGILEKLPFHEKTLSGADHSNRGIIISPKPFSLNENENAKWNGGHIGFSGQALNTDDVGFITELLDYISTQLQTRLEEKDDPSIGTDVIDAKRIFAAGYSMGATMCYRLASASPLVAISENSYSIAAIAHFAGTIGGHPTLDEFNRGVNGTSFAPGVSTSNCSIMHIKGLNDTQVADETHLSAPDYDGGYSDHHYNQMLSVLQHTPTISENNSRWDYRTDYGLWLWILHNDSLGLSGITSRGDVTASYSSTSSLYGITLPTITPPGSPTITSFVTQFTGLGSESREICGVLVPNEGHNWPESWEIDELIWEFFMANALP